MLDSRVKKFLLICFLPGKEKSAYTSPAKSREGATDRE